MKLAKHFLSVALAAAALMGATQAQAVTTWNFSYTGPSLTASGSFKTAGTAAAPEDVISITGVRNGIAITGLVPLNSDDNYSYDNQFMAAAPYFTSDGLLLSMASGENVNVYFFAGGFADLQIVNGNVVETPITFSVTAAVPEASTLAYMALGLGGVGFVMRRRRQSPSPSLPLAA